MSEYYNYWIWLSTLNLLILTWQDHRKNKMLIDDRRNYLMMGLTISLISHTRINFFYLTGLIILNIIFVKYLSKLKLFGEGDLSAFNWILLGFGIISPIYWIYFNIILVCFTLLYMLIKKIIVKNMNLPTPFFIVILLSFFLTSIFFSLY